MHILELVFYVSYTYLRNKIERNKWTLSLMATAWILWLEDNNNLCTFAKKWMFLWKMIYVCWSCLIFIDNALNIRIKLPFYTFALSPLFDIIYNPFQSLIKALSWQCTACLYLPFVFSHGLEVKLLWDFGGTHAPVNVLK